MGSHINKIKWEPTNSKTKEEKIKTVLMTSKAIEQKVTNRRYQTSSFQINSETGHYLEYVRRVKM